ncbi:hypothetical protein Tfer_0741 [Thermincola ferriacetica]|uniref:Uncharacterized protein n=1 Tax=Thermincola ferriacetica TaxID=281456 RepID=A0A0L6W4Q2_9FIRM|nr:hypothetical protein [Thermincola ferriacetica]KNZ70557.1 hypothetical protein Tfer_0741 [Thermincola ferriacetica]
MNKWFKLAVVAFAGIVISLGGLYFVQAFDGQNTHSGTNHTTYLQGQIQGGANQPTGNFTGQFQHDGYQGFIPNQFPGPFWGIGHANNAHYPLEMQNRINMINQQMNQMRYQMNFLMNQMSQRENMNMSGPSNMNDMNEMNRMPMM